MLRASMQDIPGAATSLFGNAQGNGFSCAPAQSAYTGRTQVAETIFLDSVYPMTYRPAYVPH